MAVFVRRRPEAFEEDDLLPAEEITARAAVCVDNARRYMREGSIAGTLQRSLLPQRPPRKAAVEVASRCAGGPLRGVHVSAQTPPSALRDLTRTGEPDWRLDEATEAWRPSKQPPAAAG